MNSFNGQPLIRFLQPIDVWNLEDEMFHPLNIRASLFKFPYFKTRGVITQESVSTNVLKICAEDSEHETDKTKKSLPYRRSLIMRVMRITIFNTQR